MSRVEQLSLADRMRGGLDIVEARTSLVSVYSADELSDKERSSVAQEEWEKGATLLQPHAEETTVAALRRQIHAYMNLGEKCSPRPGLAERGNVPSQQHALSKRTRAASTVQCQRQRTVATGPQTDSVALFVMRRRDLPMLSNEEYTRLRSKSVLFVRHAESVYQADERPFQAKCADKSLLDSALTPLGHRQAAELGRALAQQHMEGGGDGQNAYDLIVSSPLSRCMQTAALAFSGRSDRDITVLQALTEKVDSYGDVSRPLTQRLALHKELQAWSWHEDTSEHDCASVQLWSTSHTAVSEYGPVAGRPYEDIHTSVSPPRVTRVWRWLSCRPEQHIAVVTHSKLLGFPDRDYGLLLARATQVGRKFENAEAVEVSFAMDDDAVEPGPTLSRTSSTGRL